MCSRPNDVSRSTAYTKFHPNRTGSRKVVTSRRFVSDADFYGLLWACYPNDVTRRPKLEKGPPCAEHVV